MDRIPASTHLSDVRDWCIRNDFHPDRRQGQNFLVDANIADVIVSSAGDLSGQPALEIGPGFGILTERMLARDMRVTAVEKDARLCEILRRRWSGHPGFHLIEDDALNQPWPEMLGRFAGGISNLPYAVGTRLLMRFSRIERLPSRWVLMVQRQVADRLAAPPGSAARGLAGVWIQRRFDVREVRRVAAACFWPRPAVASSVVGLTLHDRAPLDPLEALTFCALTRLSFMHRRKQLLSLWRQLPAPAGGVSDGVLRERFRAAEVRTDARPEALTVGDWCALARVWAQGCAVPEAWRTLSMNAKPEDE